MAKKLKILVIRFSSIGDIVLTTPIIRCLKEQLNADVDFLTKDSFKTLLASNPNINRVFHSGVEFEELIKDLKTVGYDHIIDLQNSIRSLKVRSALKVNSFTYSKNRFKRFLLLKFGKDVQKNHVVDRYFSTIETLNVKDDNKGIDYFLNDSTSVNFDTNQDYLTWCIGGTHEPKRLSAEQISKVISKLNKPVVLLGSKGDKELSSKIVELSNSSNLFDFCGETSLEESALLIKESKIVLSNDTGMMHIASAYNAPIISFWGCTKPSLGFYPYQANEKSIQLISSLAEKPCSKHGKKCNFQTDGCIKTIKPQEILEAISKIQS